MTKIIFNRAGILYSLMALLVLSINLYTPVASAQVAGHSSDFNHMRTGFPLTGVHTNVECETCHVGGIFKGTPTACDGCHSAGRRVVATYKSANHIVTTAACETCHTNTVSFLGARFNHIGVQPKACATCHNGSMAPGKPGGHVVTVASCDSCHRSSAWIPAGFEHLSANPPVMGRCADCHNGITATGKYSQHLVTSLSCDSAGCHTNTGYITFAGLKYNHAGVIPGQCGTCHSGQTVGAPTQTPGHIPYTGNGCDNCHLTPPAATSFYPATMNHAVITLGCSKCHNGAYATQGVKYGGAMAKKSGHVSTTQECNVCHHDPAYSTFVGGVMDHTGIVNNCASCHGTGTNGAKVKTPGVHIPTTNSCESCHSTGVFTSFQGVSATMNHAVETGQACSVCHGGAYTSQGSKFGGSKAKTSVGNHIPVSTECGICHTGYTSFTSPLSSNTTQHTLGMTGIPCRTCHATGTNYLGVTGTKEAVSHKNADVGITGVDCSQSQCHRPTGSIGTSYIRFTN
jgi:hypothetical protein